ncbi:hypothetical protein BX600DRAFT_29872 [Xylariales sp. PMI_506]|nr:hypothetical protein BX600DRAFT_29872 [Xylariales sp. PMI_506]
MSHPRPTTMSRCRPNPDRLVLGHYGILIPWEGAGYYITSQMPEVVIAEKGIARISDLLIPNWGMRSKTNQGIGNAARKFFPLAVQNGERKMPPRIGDGARSTSVEYRLLTPTVVRDYLQNRGKRKCYGNKQDRMQFYVRPWLPKWFQRQIMNDVNGQCSTSAKHVPLA